MSVFYTIDSTRVSHREYLWDTKSPVVLVAFLLKWLRIRIPNSTDDPNVESTYPFLVEALPEDVMQRFEPIAHQLAELGFLDPVYHYIHDAGTGTTLHWATYRHSSGQHFARIHQRVWQQARTPDRGTFVVFLTSMADGTFVASSSGKPDLATPETVPMLRRRGASPAALWSAHLEFVGLKGQSPIWAVGSRDELVEAIERHHVLLRDFNLARGVFRPRTEAEQSVAASVAARLQEATDGGLQHPDVVAEVERIQTARPGWGNAVVILLVSIVAFLAVGGLQRNWQFTLWLIPILLIHEGGHWLAMKIFGYRNLRMFFIPLFGAAVTGRNWNVPGWKKAIVSLAGPVPGILLGVGLTLAGLITQRPWINEAAFLFIVINAFNLLPVLPLDGGHVLHAILFCRNRWLDIAFRIAAIAGLVLLELALPGPGRLLIYIAIGMAVGLPTAFQLGKALETLRRASLPPPLDGADRIPLATADAIAGAVKAVVPAKTAAKIVAMHTVNVFETLNARPPGVLGTISFLAVHIGTVVLALLCAVLLLLDKFGGGLGNFMQSAVRQPSHSAGCDSIQRWNGPAANPDIPRNLIAATVADAAAARGEFDSLRTRVPAEASLTLVGDSVLMALPAADDAGRERWVTVFQNVTSNAFVALTNQQVTVSLMFVAPTEHAATNLVEDLEAYLGVVRFGVLIPPWAPEAAGPGYAAALRARRIWHQIETNGAAAWSSSVVEAYNRQIVAATKRGSKAKADALRAEQAVARKKEETALLDRLRRDGIDSELIDLYAQLAALDFTNRTERIALNRKVATRLDPAPEAAHAPAKSPARDGVTSGFVMRQGLLIELRWAAFLDASVGLPTLVEWLCRQQCSNIRYELLSAAMAYGGDAEPEVEE